MIGRICCALVVALSMLATAPASAQEKTNPKEIVIGVVTITMDSEYVVLEVNGEKWAEYYFEEDGYSLVVEGVDRTKKNVFKLTPIYEELKFAEVTFKPKDWKLARLDKQTRQWQARRKVKFKKWKEGEREKYLSEEEAREVQRLKDEQKKAEEDARRMEEEKKKAEEMRRAEEAKKAAEAKPDSENNKAPTVREGAPEAEKTEEPKAEEPKAEEPKAEEPKAEEPKAEEPKAEEPKAEEPKAENPATEPEAKEPEDNSTPRASEGPAPEAPAE